MRCTERSCPPAAPPALRLAQRISTCSPPTGKCTRCQSTSRPSTRPFSFMEVGAATTLREHPEMGIPIPCLRCGEPLIRVGTHALLPRSERCHWPPACAASTMRVLNWGGAIGLLNVGPNSTLALDSVSSECARRAAGARCLACTPRAASHRTKHACATPRWMHLAPLVAFLGSHGASSTCCAARPHGQQQRCAAYPRAGLLPAPPPHLRRCPRADPGNRTKGVELLPVEVKGSPLWPTVLGADGHKAAMVNMQAQVDIQECNPAFVEASGMGGAAARRLLRAARRVSVPARAHAPAPPAPSCRPCAPACTHVAFRRCCWHALHGDQHPRCGSSALPSTPEVLASCAAPQFSSPCSAGFSSHARPNKRLTGFTHLPADRGGAHRQAACAAGGPRRRRPGALPGRRQHALRLHPLPRPAVQPGLQAAG